MREDNPDARSFYELEAYNQQWSAEFKDQMLPSSSERSQGHPVLHVSFGNSFGLASA